MSEVIIEIFKGIVSIMIFGLPIFIILLFIFSWQNRRKASYLEKSDYTILQIKIPKTNDKTPTAAEMMFATLHGILRPKSEIIREGKIQEHLSFEMVADPTTISFFVWTPKHLKDFVEGQIYAQYPSAEISETEDYTKKPADTESNVYLSAAEIVLTHEDYLPIKTFNNFQVDPLAGITGVLSKLDNHGEEFWIQMLARPVTDTWKRRGLNWVQKKKEGRSTLFSENASQWFWAAPLKFLFDLMAAVFVVPGNGEVKVSNTSEDEGRISAIELKSEKLAYEVKIRVIYKSCDAALLNERMNAIFGAFKQFNTTNLNGFKGKIIHNSKKAFMEYRNRIFSRKGFLLNIEEVASIYHLPHTTVETPNINWTTSKTGEPPTDIPTELNTEKEDLTLFAETNFRNHREIFGAKRDDRRRHTYIIGKSGMGKTKLLENLIMNDVIRGEGVAVMDPHGDLTTDALNKIPTERINDVIIFDPADTQFPIGFNPMEVMDPNMKIQIASGIVSTFKKIFGDSWGPRLEYILNYTVLALLDTEGSTLLGIVSMLTDKNFRKNIIANIQDPVVKKFWTTEFASYSEKFATEAIAPILNKVGQFVANSLIRNIIGQPKSTFNLREAMDKKKIFLINLSKGLLGETNASLLGSLMITSLQLAAMSRANMAEEERPDFYLYVDEFQNFATESFENILSEARKYRLNLIMANQYISQMEDKVREAVFGNVGTMITFRVGAQDAGVLEKEFNPPFEGQDLINLARQHIYIRMTIDGESKQAFSAKVLTVTSESSGNIEDIKKQSREKYTKSRESVEAEIATATGVVIGPPEAFAATSQSSVSIPQSSTDDEPEFEAPIVKKAGKRGKSKVAAEDLRLAIAENTSHINKQSSTKIDEKANVAQPKTTSNDSTDKAADIVRENQKTEERPLKIKDKIDKEILSEILKTVVEPKSLTKDFKESKLAENISTEIKVQEKGSEPTEKTESKKINNKIRNENSTERHFPSSAKEKIITPENFKETKVIHPHEVVKIAENSDKNPKDLIEGQIVKF